MIIQGRAKSQKSLTKSENSLRLVEKHNARKLIDKQEEERERLARELHDELGQILAVLKLDISWLENQIPDKDNPIQAKFSDINKSLDTTMNSVDKIAHQLRPSILDHLGLKEAMKWQLSEIQKRVNFQVELDFSINEKEINPKFHVLLFRIFQEGITNVVKHAEADQVTISLLQNADNVILEIQDNGRGLGSKKSSGEEFGIIGIQQRVKPYDGTMTLQNSEKGSGTTLRVNIPAKELARSLN